MHLQKDLTGKFLQLKDILSEIKALLEWQKLKVFEDTRNPSRQLLFSDDTSRQLSNQYNRFLSVSAEIDHILKTNTRLVKQSPIIKEYDKIYWQLYYLGTDVRVY